MSQDLHPLSPEQRYTQRKKIAQGGTSNIYRVFDTVLRRHVAMKVLVPEAKDYPEEIQRFIEEAQITAQLEHPNIIPIYDQGHTHNQLPYFTLKLIKGGTLFDLLQQKDYDPGTEADLYHFLQIFLKVCDALSFAHSHGVIHRDLKPENIMVGSHGQVYLMDFGLVRLVDISQPANIPPPTIDLLRDPKKLDLDTPGEVLGSFLYLPPEQALGELYKINEKTDVFALGAILYEILTKAPIYHARTHEELLQKAQACEIIPPQERLREVRLPPELCRITMKAVQKEPEARYPSVEAMQQELEYFLQGTGRLLKQSFPKGSQLITEGEPGNTVYMMERGHCLVYKQFAGQKKVLREMGPGDVFGETAAFSSRKRTASVEALDDVVVREITAEAFAQEFGLNSWINRVLRALSSRFADLDREFTSQNHTLHEIQLLNKLLIQLQLQGKPNNTAEALQAPWLPIAETICTEEGPTHQELTTFVEGHPCFSLYEGQLRVQLDGLASWNPDTADTDTAEDTPHGP